ncbi:MAG: hypothetical protein J3K34DRAFT_525216 [Monoraphidium minutum]|nr:MAG: hypothetical protein J3K34DRAFT_525216 [Monoraphidium minutum]
MLQERSMSYTQLARRGSLVQRGPGELGTVGSEEWGGHVIAFAEYGTALQASGLGLANKPRRGGALGSRAGSGANIGGAAPFGGARWLSWRAVTACMAALLLLASPAWLAAPRPPHAPAGAPRPPASPFAAPLGRAPPHAAAAAAAAKPEPWRRRAAAAPPAAPSALERAAGPSPILDDSFPRYFSFCADSPAGCGAPAGVKVISASLGPAPAGGAAAAAAAAAARVARDAFPDWELWVYYSARDNEAEFKVDPDVLQQLADAGARLLPVDGPTMAEVGAAPAAWRLLAADDAGVARFVVRDLTWRPLLRERLALDEWEDSGLPFHVMRDHPSHTDPITPDLWGAVRGPHLPSLRAALRAHARARRATNGVAPPPGFDAAAFLASELWPAMAAAGGGGVRQHDAFSCEAFAPAAPGVTSGFPLARGAGREFAGMGPSGPAPPETDAAPACAPSAAPPGARLEVRLAPEPEAAAAGGGGPAPFASVQLSEAARAAARGGPLAKAPPGPLIAAYELRSAFVDGAAACGGGGASPAPPVLYDRGHVFRLGRRRYRRCAPPPPAAVPQPDGPLWPGGEAAAQAAAAALGSTDSTSSGGGVRSHALLVVADALTGPEHDERFVTAEWLPALAFALARLPPRGRILLRDDRATDALMEAAIAAGPAAPLTWGGAPVAPEHLRMWRFSPWAAPHRPGQRHFARRLVVLASSSGPLAALPAASDHAVNAAIAGSAADASLARAAHLLHAPPRGLAPPRPARPPCRLARLGDGGGAAGVAAPAGWAADDAPDAAGADEHVRAAAGAAALVATAGEPPLYLPFARPGALVLWLPKRGAAAGGGGSGAPLLCALGRVTCVELAADPSARAAQAAAALSEVDCEPLGDHEAVGAAGGDDGDDDDDEDDEEPEAAAEAALLLREGFDGEGGAAAVAAAAVSSWR